MSLRLWILILAAGLSLHARAVDAVCSYAVFYTQDASNSRTASIETVWQVNPVSLHYRKNENGDLVSQIQTDLVFTNETGSIIHEEHYILKTTPAAPGAATAIKILDMQRTSLPPGKVRLQLKLSEPEVKVSQPYIFTDSLLVNPPDNIPFYSNLQLIDTFIDVKKEGIFFKNNRQQIPMPTNFFDDNRKSLNYYTELYQTVKTDTDVFPLRQRIFISRRMQEGVLAGLEKADTLTAGNMLFKSSGHFSLEHLGSGNYYLNAELTNRTGQVVASNSTFFQLINKNPVPMSTVADTAKSTAATPQSMTYLNLDKTFVAKFTLPQLKAILKMLLPVSDPVQTRVITGFLQKPDDIYMRYFIYNYFTAKDKDHPEKAWEEFADRIREINRQFGKGGRNGYETERGFVYLKYGKPDDIVSVPSEPGALPYEVWQYYALGKQSQEGIFLFYQPGFLINDFKLLHSTVTGEVKNPNWKSVLYTNGKAGNNSRADQLIRNR
ncbi:GWxTD domain-containing protein [Chitinophagaceae bacterium MMS25-I14]